MTNQNQNTNQNPPKGEDKSGSSRILIVIGAVIAIAAIIAVLFLIFGGGGSSNTPAPTAPPISTAVPSTVPPNPTAVPPTVTIPTPQPGVPMVTALTVMNVRSGPSMEYPIYGQAPEGSQAVVIGKSADGGWWLVEIKRTDLVPSGQGWVSADPTYVKAENTENVPVAPAPDLPPGAEFPPPDPNGPIATALDVIYVRSGPGTQYPAYGLGQPGQQAAVVGKSEDGKWWVVQIQRTDLVPSGQGWVSADYVSVKNVEGVPVIPAP